MFTLEFERASKLSLPISANALRVLSRVPIRLRELPRLAGISKGAMAMSLGLLEKLECAVVEPDPSATRGKVARLNPKGQRAQLKYHRVLAETEAHWEERFGAQRLSTIRGPLEALVGPPGGPSPLFRGLQPYPEGWRALLPAPGTLPHYPMVLHRGGWPDGA
jgi:DNA-binding MarR family transcriptional regulator